MFWDILETCPCPQPALVSIALFKNTVQPQHKCTTFSLNSFFGSVLYAVMILLWRQKPLDAPDRADLVIKCEMTEFHWFEQEFKWDLSFKAQLITRFSARLLSCSHLSGLVWSSVNALWPGSVKKKKKRAPRDAGLSLLSNTGRHSRFLFFQ